jgi:hypothetical protein
MKLYDISAGEFIALLEHTKGNIYLATGDGVFFNLSSKLSQLYCIKMLLDGSKGNEMSPEIKIEDESDRKMFQQYLVNRHTKCGNLVR